MGCRAAEDGLQSRGASLYPADEGGSAIQAKDFHGIYIRKIVIHHSASGSDRDRVVAGSADDSRSCIQC